MFLFYKQKHVHCFFYGPGDVTLYLSKGPMKQNPQSTNLTFDHLLQRAEHYCAYRDRCVKEVEQKLFSLGGSAPQVMKVISKLLEDGFIDEGRFCLGFVRGKLNNNKWGRNRILMELNMRQIPGAIITQALHDIDPGEYQQILANEAKKKAASLKETDTFTRQGKIAAYLMNKGFESDLVWKVLKEEL